MIGKQLISSFQMSSKHSKVSLQYFNVTKLFVEFRGEQPAGNATFEP
jgi:hypothetical protein